MEGEEEEEDKSVALVTFFHEGYNRFFCFICERFLQKVFSFWKGGWGRKRTLHAAASVRSQRPRAGPAARVWEGEMGAGRGKVIQRQSMGESSARSWGREVPSHSWMHFFFLLQTRCVSQLSLRSKRGKKNVSRLFFYFFFRFGGRERTHAATSVCRTNLTERTAHPCISPPLCVSLNERFLLVDGGRV